jgi:hypothetical protein
MEEEGIDHAPWPERAALLAGLGALFGFAIYSLAESAERGAWTHSAAAMGAAAFLSASGIALALALERVRWTWSAAFAGVLGAIVGFAGWRNGAPDQWGGGEGWQFFSAVLAAALATPLFQAVRDRGRFVLSPPAVLAHAWTDLILFAAAGAFVVAAILLTLLLTALFGLIGVTLPERLVEEGWPMAMIACGSFGGAVGLLRDRGFVIDILQRVARTILSVLAPAFAIGLVLFVVALPFTGLEPLWEKTKSTTPILLVTILGAVVLVNAVVGNRREEESGVLVVRLSAAALAVIVLPLALVAAVSTAKRVGQYGFTPDRLWAAVFVAVALAFAVSYLVALVRGRGIWGDSLRRANVRLAVGLCAIALLLALPIVSFGALSARDQVARLESGRVTPERFDWAAMRFDFGAAGRSALDRLARTGPPAVRSRAAAALKAESRWALGPSVAEPPHRPSGPPKLLVTPQGSAPPPALVTAVAETGWCAEETCRLALIGSEAVLLSRTCDGCLPRALVLRPQPDGRWVWLRAAEEAPRAPPIVPERMGESVVEIRPMPRRQVFVDGRPVGELLE